MSRINKRNIVIDLYDSAMKEWTYGRWKIYRCELCCKALRWFRNQRVYTEGRQSIRFFDRKPIGVAFGHLWQVVPVKTYSYIYDWPVNVYDILEQTVFRSCAPNRFVIHVCLQKIHQTGLFNLIFTLFFLCDFLYAVLIRCTKTNFIVFVHRIKKDIA